jgi:uncharacterized protein (TIGR02246 family)
MYKLMFFLATLTSASGIIAQSTEHEVNRDVWYPFISAYDQLDAEGFMSVHTDDVLRVNRDGRTIRSGQEYSEAMHQYFQSEKANGAQLQIDLRFLERFYSEDAGFEVGIYRVIRAAGGVEQSFYGKFHVLLRKVEGTWKIAMDSDISNNGMIREEDFMAAKPLPDQ